MEIRPEEFLSFGEWLAPALKFCVIAIPVLIALALFAWYLVSAVRRGPVEGFYAVAQVIASALGRDLPGTSARRIWALTRLTIQEALRRRVIIGFVIFAVVFLFAGWFLDVKSDDPAHLYLSFVLTTTNYLVIALALFLSAFSLPADIKSKTIFTIVTKPVRPGEIVLGRVLGFVGVISVLLILMCFVSYLFVVRGLDHEHTVAIDSITRIEPELESEESPGWEGTTSLSSHHRHKWQVDKEGRGRTDNVMGHQHSLTVEGNPADPQQAVFRLGPPQEQLMARVPIYGQLRFLDTRGNPAQRGINVGKEWEYRSYIQGQTFASAIWTFEGLTEDRFPKGLPLAMTLSVYRTYKGDLERGIRGIIIVRRADPRDPLECEPIPFVAEEFATQEITIPPKLKPVGAGGIAGKEVDLFGDLVRDDGRLEIIIRCDDVSQYFGMAQADLYIRAADAPFAWNFVKSYMSIWLQMVLVVCLGVMFSTFLSSAVAMLATVAAILLGYFGQFVREMWTGEAFGGGPVESLVRLVTQANMIVELDVNVVTRTLLKYTDYVLLTIMHSLSAILPKFGALARPAEYVSYNFNIYGAMMARNATTVLLYALALIVVGTFFLKTRELAA
jgi:hypothetical protein